MCLPATEAASLLEEIHVAVPTPSPGESGRGQSTSAYGNPTTEESHADFEKTAPQVLAILLDPTPRYTSPNTLFRSIHLIKTKKRNKAMTVRPHCRRLGAQPGKTPIVTRTKTTTPLNTCIQ
ncbi:hypothetical protein BST61_g1803 [Cercospora zeina]